MQDNRETNPEIVLSQQRSGRNQATLNVELGLLNRENVGSSGSQGATSAGVNSIGGGSIIAIELGGTGEGGGRINCFAGNTMVRMADNQRKPIYALASGLHILAPDENGKVRPGRVIGRKERFYKDWLRVSFADKRFVEVRPNHRYRTEGGRYVQIAEADHVMHYANGAWVRIEITEKAYVTDQLEKLFYNLEIEGYGAYLADDDWVSNAKVEGDREQI